MFLLSKPLLGSMNPISDIRRQANFRIYYLKFVSLVSLRDYNRTTHFFLLLLELVSQFHERLPHLIPPIPIRTISPKGKIVAGVLRVEIRSRQ